MTKVVILDGVSKRDATGFGAFLLGNAAGAGVPENPDTTKAMLTRGKDGEVIAQYKGITLAEATLDKRTGAPAIKIMDVTPSKAHEGVLNMFKNAYETWSAHVEEAYSPEIAAKIQELLDPPKNGAPEVTLEAVTRAELEVLSLRDVLRNVMPKGVELVKFQRNDEVIRVYYELSEGRVQVPLMSARHTKATGTIMRSGDGKSPAPVGFFLNLLQEAKRYNNSVCGLKKVEASSKGLTTDNEDNDVMQAFSRYLTSQTETKDVQLNDNVMVTVSPKTQSVIVYIDRNMVAQSKLLDGKDSWDHWVRPGHGWSSRAEFSQRAIVAGGRKMLAENIISMSPGEDWANDLEAAFQ